jgi:hypothetical protein
VYQQFFDLANERAPPIPDGVERMEALRGYWSLEPVAPDRTRIEYVLYTDPGGWVPSFTVNLATPGTIPARVRAVESRAKDPRWHLGQTASME